MQSHTKYKLYRFLKGGLWVFFDTGDWVNTTWSIKEKGCIYHPQDGGQFHKRFNQIKTIEDYKHGHDRIRRRIEAIPREHQEL